MNRYAVNILNIKPIVTLFSKLNNIIFTCCVISFIAISFLFSNTIVGYLMLLLYNSNDNNPTWADKIFKYDNPIVSI